MHNKSGFCHPCINKTQEATDNCATFLACHKACQKTCYKICLSVGKNEAKEAR